MEEKNYVYKVKGHLLRKEKLLEYGFHLCKDKDDEQSTEIIYAFPLKLAFSSPISQGLVKVIEQARKSAQNENLDEIDDNTKQVSVLFDESNEELVKTVTECQLCVSTGEEWKDVTKGMLFINDPSQTTYYNSKVLDEHCGNIIKLLLNDGIIYKKLAI